MTRGRVERPPADPIDAVDLEVRIGRNWHPVSYSGPPAPVPDQIEAIGRALRQVSLGSRLRWADPVGGLGVGGHDGDVGLRPREVRGEVWTVHVDPRSVIVLAERSAEGVLIGARLTSAAAVPNVVEIERPFAPDRAVTVVAGERDHALERFALSAEATCEGPAVAGMADHVPRELVIVGTWGAPPLFGGQEWVGVAYAVPGRPEPLVIWLAAEEVRWRLPDDLHADPIALMAEGAFQLGLVDDPFHAVARGIVRARAAGDPPPLEYAQLLDPGERVIATATVNP